MQPRVGLARHARPDPDDGEPRSIGAHAAAEPESRPGARPASGAGPAAADDEAMAFAPTAAGPIIAARRFWHHASYVAGAGLLVQILLALALLGFGHAPVPHQVPLGLVGPAPVRAPVASALARGNAFAVRDFPDRVAAARAIRDRRVYGAIVLSGSPEILIAGAASPLVANTLRRLPATAPALLGSATVTDLVPLPADDGNGGSLALMLQVLVTGGSLASLGLGRLLPRFRAPIRRGVLPGTFLIGYALVSAAAMEVVMRGYGIGAGADRAHLFLVFTLLSLSITASVSAAVALLGPLGSVPTGVLYFLLGVPLSGAGLPPEFLPAGFRVLGRVLPTGGGAQAIRSVLYFGGHAAAPGIAVMALYAGAGVLILLVLNLLPARAQVA